MIDRLDGPWRGRLNNNRILLYTKFSAVFYLLVFQAWKVFEDYPAGVLSEDYNRVGIFNILPGPLSDSAFDFICYLWPVFLIMALIPKVARIGLFGSFILGCYVLGYHYNFGRTFHGTSLILQILLVLAIGTPSRKKTAAEKEAIATITVGVAQLVICLAYFASGIAKVLKSGPSWAFSENLAVILHTQPLSTPIQNWLLGLPSPFLQALAAFAFLFEVTALLPWFFSRLTGIYLVAWSVFHIGVALTLGGHVTFLSHLFLFPVFIGSALLGASGFQRIRGRN